jgi:hypothetical protein
MLVITPIAKQFNMQTVLFNNVLQGIDDSHGGDRITGHINHLQWIAGHLTGSRNGIAELLGLQHTFPYKEIYADPTQPPPGNRALDTSLTYPPLSEIIYYWNEFAPAFNIAISRVSNEQLAMALPAGTPFKTVLDLLGFVASHESYHIGQMSLIRKYLGLDAMSYKGSL